MKRFLVVAALAALAMGALDDHASIHSDADSIVASIEAPAPAVLPSVVLDEMLLVAPAQVYGLRAVASPATPTVPGQVQKEARFRRPTAEAAMALLSRRLLRPDRPAWRHLVPLG